MLSKFSSVRRAACSHDAACFTSCGLIALLGWHSRAEAQNLFDAPQTIVGASASHFVLADFNGDGKSDLLTVGKNTATGMPTASIAPGNGNGTFGGATTFFIGVSGSALAAGDFNGDGKLDFIAADSSNSVRVYLGRGDGTFTAAPTAATGYSPAGLAVGDFNGDGKLDVVVSNNHENTVSVLLGKGDGTFQTKRDFAVGITPGEIAVGDFNGDSKPDLAVISVGYINSQTYQLIGGTTVSVLLGRSDGTFQPKQDFTVGQGAKSVAVGDINGDGKLDLAVAHANPYFNPYNLLDSTSILRGNGDGTFGSASEVAAGKAQNSLTLRDINGDGKLDLIAGSGDPANPGSLTTHVFSVTLGNGDGTFQNFHPYSAGLTPVQIAVGNVRGSGKPDVVALNSNGTLTTVFNNGDGTFAAPPFLAPSNPYRLFVADVNGDGIPDVIATSPNSSGSNIVLQISNGDGTFQPPVTYSMGPDPRNANQTGDVFVADVNGDGIADMIAAYTTQQVVGNYVQNVFGYSLFLGTGGGQFQPAVRNVLGQATRLVFAVADVNGDGRPDLLEASTVSYTPTAAYYGVFVRLNNGDGTFGAPARYFADNVDTTTQIIVQDVNGDGWPDLVSISNYGVQIALNNGDGTFGLPQTYANDILNATVQFGDFNGDGRPDLAVIGTLIYTNTTYLDILLNTPQGFQRTSRQLLLQASASGLPLILADVNGDGKLDVLTATGSLQVFLGSGDGTLQNAVSYAFPAYSSGLYVIDADRDGILDVVFPTIYSSFGVLHGNGDGTFQSGHLYALGTSVSSFALADFNNDGRPDVAALDYSGASVSFNLPVNLPVGNTLSGHLSFEGIVPGAAPQNVVFQFHPLDGSGDFVRNAAVAPTGGYSLSGLPAKSYSVRIKSDQYLAVRRSVDLTVNAALDAIQKAGDGNGDNVVDIGDFGLLVNSYSGLAANPASGYDVRADFNGDGVVDIADFGLLVNNYGLTGAP